MHNRSFGAVQLRTCIIYHLLSSLIGPCLLRLLTSIVFDSLFWLQTCKYLNEHGYKISDALYDACGYIYTQKIVN